MLLGPHNLVARRTMFLFTSDSELLDESTARVNLAAWGRPEFRKLGQSHVVWTDDGFTSCRLQEGVLEIQRSLAGIDCQPICGFRWCVDSCRVELFRRWSGEFVLYYRADRVLIVASDLKLFKLLDQAPGKRPKRLEPGCEIAFRFRRDQWVGAERKVSRFSNRFPYDFDTTVQKVRELVQESVSRLPDNTALLLSGGIDSSAIAAAARSSGREFRAFTFCTSTNLQPKQPLQNDLLCATRVAKYLGIRTEAISITPECLVDNLRLAVFLSETPRGTIIDDSVALIELAKLLHRNGYRYVCMGEAADDLFGGFKFAFRYYRGTQLRSYFRQQLDRDLPNELAIIQNNFSPWGVSIIQPFWTDELLRIGYNLPLRYRVDRKRLMKSILREAFRADLPEEIVSRPKCVTRDANGVRRVMEEAFGTSRERYRPVFDELFRVRQDWPEELASGLTRWTGQANR